MTYVPKHSPLGDPCERSFRGRRCNHPASAHEFTNPNDAPIVCIDGEGKGDDPHNYVLLCAVDEYGVVRGELTPEPGRSEITTRQAFDFLLDLGEVRVFGFSLGYDYTKILKDLSNLQIYKLVRPETRQRIIATDKGDLVVHDKVYWTDINSGDKQTFELDMIRSRLSLRRAEWDPKLKRGDKIGFFKGVGPRLVVWDVFRFFGASFVNTLISWKVAPIEKLTRMRNMKEKRSQFDKQTDKEIRDYCVEETEYMARLTRSLIQSHSDIGLELKAFYGAGTTGKTMLETWGVKTYRGHLCEPEEMRRAVHSAFFGGRFECSRIGPIPGPVYNYDISSAYPYHILHLPCLACGSWELVKGKGLQRAIETSRLALVNTRLPRIENPMRSWGPLPHRLTDGTIQYPLFSAGGWVWQDEFLAAQKYFSQVKAVKAWVYHANCDHAPFSRVPEYYRERVRIGKEGKGHVYKLGLNSGYGQIARSVGIKPPFQSWIWAGLITSNTRAQLLPAIGGSGDDGWPIVMVATDGIFSTAPLTLPVPKETGTGSILSEEKDKLTGEFKLVKKPLGGWEMTRYDQGVFILRPGIYFPIGTQPDLDPDVDPERKQEAGIKARGIQKRILHEHARLIELHWKMNNPLEMPNYIVGRANETDKQLRRFVGINSGVRLGGHKAEAPFVRSENYGKWIPYPVEVNFSPMPKRSRVLAPDNRLEAHEYPTTDKGARFAGQSTPYGKCTGRSVISEEEFDEREAAEIFNEQAEGDFRIE